MNLTNLQAWAILNYKLIYRSNDKTSPVEPRPATLLTYQSTEGNGRFSPPGDTLQEKNQGHCRTFLQRELRDRLGLDVSRNHIHEVKEIKPDSNYRYFIVTAVRSGPLMTNPKDRLKPVHGLGFLEPDGVIIPRDRLTPAAAVLEDFLKDDHNTLYRVSVTEGLTIPGGYINEQYQNGKPAPEGTISWNTLSRGWRA